MRTRSMHAQKRRGRKKESYQSLPWKFRKEAKGGERNNLEQWRNDGQVFAIQR